MAYKRKYGKKSYGRKRRMGGTSGRSSALAPIYDPFSNRVLNPKIPDGKANVSSGLRLQHASQYALSASKAEFLLHPSICTPLVSYAASNRDPDPGTGAIPAFGASTLSNHTQFTVGAAEVTNNTAMIKWRLVSCGLRFTLINNSDENDGWFEAIRLPLNLEKLNADAFTWDPAANGVLGNGYTLPALPFPWVQANQNLVENASYVTGKLRNIHRYQFNLKSNNNDHDYVNYIQKWKKTYANETELDNWSQLPYLDPQYDAVFIRIHGRAGTSPTKVLAHVISNQEVIYDEASALHRHSTYAPKTSMQSVINAYKSQTSLAANTLKRVMA